jgi:RNase H-fold protein (predicted Holliday junction resolvase)
MARTPDAPKMSAAGPAQTVLAIDPGRQKCGLAVVRGPEGIACLHRCVVETVRLVPEVAALLRAHDDIAEVLVGSATSSKQVRTALAAYFPEYVLRSVDEHRSSERARARYLAENKPAGLGRILPNPLRTPEAPYDDYVALILAEDYFAALVGSAPVAGPEHSR